MVFMKKIIVANWKCNPPTYKKFKQLFAQLQKKVRNFKKVELVICPPFVYLPFFFFSRSSFPTQHLPFKLGAQNCFWEEEGPFTGEISPKMLKDLGCSYVILGHSERREFLGEKDKEIGKKLKASLENKLRPILCVGETEEERKKGRIFKVVERQLLAGIKKVKKQEIEKVIIAYEPIWAIGTGISCSSNEVLTAALVIRKIIAKKFNQKIACQIQVLYGGSVKEKNAPDYLTQPHLNGLLVGGASLKIEEFGQILKIASNLGNN